MDDEYLLTNQLGGYCSSTFHSGNTRKYHGLLIITNANLQRKLIVSSLEEKITSADTEEVFSTNTFYPSEVKAQPAKFLKNVSIDNQQVALEYAVGEVKIFKEIYLAKSANTVIVHYKIICKQEATFTVAPLITNRSIHKLASYQNTDAFSCSSYLNNANIQLSPTENLTVNILTANPQKLLNTNYKIKPVPQIYKNIYYLVEAGRGYDPVEDMIKNIEVSFALNPGENFISIQFSYENTKDLMPSRSQSSAEWLYGAIQSKKNEPTPTLPEFERFLKQRSKQFLVDNNSHKSIIAGFPWFDDWGRDTFISLPGLLLTTGEFKFARELLSYWGKFINEGLIPNSLESKSYNSLDASLWYIVSVYKYYQATKDLSLIKELFPKVKQIIARLMNGSTHTIGLDTDGYLVWADPKFNLSWMDSLVNEKSVTGRHGACIEIEMLWYNSLKIFSVFAKTVGDKEDYLEVEALAKRIGQKIPKDFWSEATDYVVDYIVNGKADLSIRPNVVLGMLLPFKLFSKKKADAIFKKVNKELLSDVGLLTLNKSAKDFVGRYSGNQGERDLAYHNGTIWPYLLGAYYLAILSYYPNDKDKIIEIKSGLSAFWKHIITTKLNYLPELFSPDDLHPDGCLSQAWNYATFLEVFQKLNNK